MRNLGIFVFTGLIRPHPGEKERTAADSEVFKVPLQFKNDAG